MKKTLFPILLSLILLSASACHHSKYADPAIARTEINGEKIEFDVPKSDFNGFVLNGAFKDQKSGKLYLDFLTLTEIHTIDTTDIQSNGSFQFQNHVSEKGFYRIRYADKISWVVILDNGSAVLVKLNSADLSDFEVQGDAENKRFKMINDDMYRRQNDLAKLYQERAQLLQTGATANMDQVRVIESQISSAATDFADSYKKYADTSKSIFLSLYSATFLNPEYNFDYLNKFGNRLKQEIPNSIYTKEFLTRLAAAQQAQQASQKKALDVNGDQTPAPDFTMNDVNGKPFKLSSLRGHYVLLDFWASWCGPCRRENPNVVAAYNKFKGMSFTVLSVSLDDNADAWKKAIADDKLSWPNHVCDFQKWNNEAAQKYGISAIPANFVIDPEGYIIGQDLRGQDLDDFLTDLFTPSTAPPGH